MTAYCATKDLAAVGVRALVHLCAWRLPASCVPCLLAYLHIFRSLPCRLSTHTQTSAYDSFRVEEGRIMFLAPASLSAARVCICNVGSRFTAYRPFTFLLELFVVLGARRRRQGYIAIYASGGHLSGSLEKA